MTPERYGQIEHLLARAEAIFVDSPPVSPAGKQIHSELRELLVKIVVERHRHAELDKKAEQSKPADSP